MKRKDMMLIQMGWRCSHGVFIFEVSCKNNWLFANRFLTQSPICHWSTKQRVSHHWPLA